MSPERAQLSFWHSGGEDLAALLEDVAAYLGGHSDVVDGDYGSPEPNRAMSLLARVDAAQAAHAAREALGETLVDLYRREINCGLSSFWDAGWRVWIGDAVNGFQSVAEFPDEDFERIAEWLRTQADALFPPEDRR